MLCSLSTATLHGLVGWASSACSTTTGGDFFLEKELTSK